MHSVADTVEVFDSSQRASWEEWFGFLPDALRDINYTFDYLLLYELNGDGAIRLFTYREQDAVFYYPFLIRPVKNSILGSGYQDIENVYGYTGPLWSSDEPGFQERATGAFVSWCREQKVVCEFIRFHPLLHNAEQAGKEKNITVVPLREYVYVELERSMEDIFKSYTSQNRNKIRKAEKHGVLAVRDDACEYFNEFVRIYTENMKLLKAARMYYFSPAFFQQLKKLVREKGCLVLAKKDNEILGASVFLGGGRIGHYFLSAATESGKKLAVSNLMVHAGISWSRSAGMKKLHLGGGLSPDKEDPLLVFKKNFSNLTEKFYIGKRIFDAKAYDLLVNDWDKRFADEAPKYKSILQRYRWEKEDLL